MNLKFGDRLMFIGGEFVPGASGQWIESVNPATEEVHGRVAAGQCRRTWTGPCGPPRRRNRPGRRSPSGNAATSCASSPAAMRAARQEILPLEAADTGNTIASLGRDVEVAANYIEYFAGLGTEMKGDSVPASADGIHFSLREPYGVVARIVPFNHPFLFAGAHLAAPLMAGNAVIVKTPETSPLSAHHHRARSAGRCCRRASSTSCTARACRRAMRWCGTRASGASVSPARCRPGWRSSARRRRSRSSTSRSSSAARTR